MFSEFAMEPPADTGRCGSILTGENSRSCTRSTASPTARNPRTAWFWTSPATFTGRLIVTGPAAAGRFGSMLRRQAPSPCCTASLTTTTGGGLRRAGPEIEAEGIFWGTTEFGPNCYYCGSGTVWNYDPASGTFTTVLNFSSTIIVEPQSRLDRKSVV